MPEQKALLAQQQAGLFGLGDAFFAQIDVRPSREPVFPVPCALAVAEQNNFFIVQFIVFSDSARTSFRNSRCTAKSLIFCKVVCAILSSASRVKNP